MSLAIDVQHLTKSYSGVRALSDVTFSVKKGSIHGLLGPNGAGKTTTMNCLSSLLRPDLGKMTISGKIGYLPEIPPLYKEMVVKKYLAFIGGLYGLQGHLLKKAIEEVVGQVGLVGLTERLIGNLSKGQKQRVGLASVLIPSPDILILDEPTVGLDPESIVEIRKLILSLKGDKTILISTHQLREVELSCDTISIINQGRLVLTGPLSTISGSLSGEESLVYRLTISHVQEDQKLLLADLFQSYGLTILSLSSLDSSTLMIRFSASKKNPEQIGLLTSQLIVKGIYIKSLSEEKNGLEEIYLSAINTSNTGIRGGFNVETNLSSGI